MSLLAGSDWHGRIYSGGWTEGTGGTRAVVSPSTGAEIGTIGLASAADVTAAAAAAAEAQRGWAALPYNERAAVLRRAGDLWHANAEEITDWLMRETGAIGPFGGFQIMTSAEECYEAAALASAPYGELLRSSSPRLSMSRRVPVGVVGVISPFNVPTILSIRAVAPALALGNAVILKPDPRTSVSGGAVLAEIFAAAGLPDGVWELVAKATSKNPAERFRNAKEMAEVLREPSFPEAEFDQMRKLQITSIDSAKSEPQTLGQVESRRLLNPYERGDIRYTSTLAESVEALQKVTLADIKKFHADFVGASNGELAIVGDFDTAEVEKEVGVMSI